MDESKQFESVQDLISSGLGINGETIKRVSTKGLLESFRSNCIGALLKEQKNELAARFATLEAEKIRLERENSSLSASNGTLKALNVTLNKKLQEKELKEKRASFCDDLNEIAHDHLSLTPERYCLRYDLEILAGSNEFETKMNDIEQRLVDLLEGIGYEIGWHGGE